MKRLKEMFRHLIKGMSKAFFRFPLTVIALIALAGLTCNMIFHQQTPSQVIQKFMYTFMVGALLGMAAQFALERFDRLAKKRLALYLVPFLLTAGYFLILWPAPEISPEARVRTFAAVFALACAVLWIPSYRREGEFNKVALIHFKFAFTSVLYSAVLSAGLAAIITAVNILLFQVNRHTYSYMMTLVWIIFAPVYYLSLLPAFNSEEEGDHEAYHKASNYPKFLEILVSYIAIPLAAAYTLVLTAYFVKILVTFHWPSGQLGPLVMVYSAAGLVIFVLACLLENRFAHFYCRFFPKALIPVVILQLVSVGIRLNVYGVTESRYYVALFGIYSIIIGIFLSVRPITRTGFIALLAACFAIVSVIPPVDAFTVARVSQINRVERILAAEGILSSGKLTPKSNASEKTQFEATSILSYLDQRGMLKFIKWLPKDFNVSKDMKTALGFTPLYTENSGNGSRYMYASLDTQKPVNISGYDISVRINSNRFQGNENPPVNFRLKGEEYVMSVNRLSSQEVRVSVKNKSGTEIIGSGFFEFAQGLRNTGLETKGSLPPEKMSLETARNGYRLKIIFENVNITYGSGTDAGADYTADVLFSAP